MDTEERRMQQMETAFHPRTWYRTSLAMLLFLFPALVLLVADTGPFFKLCGQAAVFLIFVFYVALRKGCKRIVFLEKEIRFEATSLSQLHKITELRQSEIYHLREYMIPLWGRVLTVRNRRGEWLCAVWISGWKMGKELKGLFVKAVEENHGLFVSWQAGLKAMPRALFGWLKDRFCLR